MFEKWSLNPLAMNVESQVILPLMQKVDAVLPDLPLPRRLALPGFLHVIMRILKFL